MNDAKEVTKQYSELGQTLVMHGQDRQPIDLLAPGLHLVSRGEQIHSASLSFQVHAGIYTHIIDEGDFNLSLEVQEEIDGPPFDGETAISIETRLHPQFLPLLEPFRNDISAASDFLLSLPTLDPDHPLIHAGNWLATQVSQNGPKGTSRYRTLWHRFNISAATIEKFESGDFSEEIKGFLRSKIGVDLAMLPDQFTPEAVNALSEEVSRTLTDGLGELFAVLPGVVSGESENVFSNGDEIIRSPIESVAAFFEEDGWNFQVTPEGNAIFTGAAGDNGEFSCQIIWEPTHEYLICYAVVPVETVPHRMAAMTEFIARANYGLPSGNFEINLDSGEVRFRTSIFVADRSLSYDEIEDFLYTAVLQTDLYLPGIMRVNYGVSPAEAIVAVEEVPSA